ncbi:exodeoxyribonuclease VII large subunit [Endozoicomonas sp. SCSIO W0465]|uniref:exodeoxyribonuclease VII large subunit n=1 Tax=Endozoicomonas sp. SCSIO W0465 TaxID=2918516 RepID=UPI0020756C6B|nr:exodeoxyribonuclease VII large subunit [Endozoicomonas sp. SCSIO W0465]USE39021.1 exodeoxyribonuclease VII large subunit [Endozoicomonas sp. SCSIO W0465]
MHHFTDSFTDNLTDNATNTPAHNIEGPAKALSVTELNGKARRLLEMNFNNVRVEGELSGLARPSSGHWYFTLKDKQSQIRCAMFRNRNQSLKFVPTEGMLLMVRGRVSLYEGRGDYQLIVEHMDNAGTGDLRKAFEVLKTKLAAEGLFDIARKQPLPSHPKHIGVITSPTGAAIRDILTVMKRRFPAIPVTIIPSAVQGEQAKYELVSAIKLAKNANRFDVLIVGRGGGSLEDLWPFNEELVARAIANCPIPIVSAVGHEIDFTIADFVADHRAATPSAAAEILSPDRQAMLNQLHLLSRKLTTLTRHKLQLCQKETDNLQKRLRHPGDRLRDNSQRLDDLEIRLRQAITLKLERAQSSLGRVRDRTHQQNPQRKLELLKNRNEHMGQKLIQLVLNCLERRQLKLEKVSGELSAVSPLATLSRGYTLTMVGESIIRSSRQLREGERVTTRFSEGKAVCKVEKITC